jgi:hypothetical protein
MRALTVCCLLTFAGPALADTTFATGSMLYGAAVTTTICSIYNAGPVALRITSVGIVPYNDSLGTTAADSDGCVGMLAPDTTCHFTGSLGVYGGGIAKVRGGTKNLRGTCILSDAGSVIRLSEQMR